MLKLPNELLDEIFRRGGNLSRQDLVNLCKTCRLFRPAAERVLYGEVSTSCSEQLVSFTRILVARPDFALQVKSFEVVNHLEEELPDSISTRMNFLHDALSRLNGIPKSMERRATESIHTVKQNAQKQTPGGYCTDGYLLLTLALAQMKSLESLNLDCRFFLNIDSVLPLFVTLSSNPVMPFNMLSKLHTLKVGSNTSSSHTNIDLAVPFLALPQMRRLSCTRPNVNFFEDRVIQCTFLRSRCALQDVKLRQVGYTFDESEIVEIIRMGKALKSFSSNESPFPKKTMIGGTWLLFYETTRSPCDRSRSFQTGVSLILKLLNGCSATWRSRIFRS